MNDWTWYTWYWVVWVHVVLVSFWVVEFLALMDPRPNDLLTENVVLLANRHWIWTAIIMAFFVWLPIHFARWIFFKR